jgi:hypothetical protein
LKIIIDGKKKKFEKYDKFDENWLLIYFDRTEPAFDQCLPLDVQLLNGICSCPFDKIFLYRTYESDTIMIAKNPKVSKLKRNSYVVS